MYPGHFLFKSNTYYFLAYKTALCVFGAISSLREALPFPDALIVTVRNNRVSAQVPTSEADLSCNATLSSILPKATITCQALTLYYIVQVGAGTDAYPADK